MLKEAFYLLLSFSLQGSSINRFIALPDTIVSVMVTPLSCIRSLRRLRICLELAASIQCPEVSWKHDGHLSFF